MILEVFELTPSISPISLLRSAKKHFGGPCALLESAMTDDNNQFSIIALDPIQEVVTQKDSFEHLRNAIAKSKKFPKSFPFSGGLIGYFNFEIFGEIESKYAQKSEYPHAIFYEFSKFYAFDHAEKKVFAIQTVGDKAQFIEDNQQVFSGAKKFTETMIDLEALKGDEYLDFSIFESQLTKAEFEKQVEAAKEKILDGEIFQMILSNGFRLKTNIETLTFYEILRKVEPTTHLVYYDFGDHGQVCAASPEILGSKRGQEVTYSPIAGTRYRGKTTQEDQQIFDEMANDPKENAEHDMLVDLGRNDLGKVCTPGSINIKKPKYGRFFANVMHLVSDISGELKKDLDAIDFFKAIFPAGTLSGAPKIRAIDLIYKAEKSPRNLYGGAAGYFSADGNMELCIMIRSFFAKDGVARFRTGAGIVQDSESSKEWLEVHNKARSLCKIFNYGLKNS